MSKFSLFYWILLLRIPNKLKDWSLFKVSYRMFINKFLISPKGQYFKCLSCWGNVWIMLSVYKLSRLLKRYVV